MIGRVPHLGCHVMCTSPCGALPALPAAYPWPLASALPPSPTSEPTRGWEQAYPARPTRRDLRCCLTIAIFRCRATEIARVVVALRPSACDPRFPQTERPTTETRLA
ncbi:hypothetical protein K470DRAFT_156158 [Piedraia hortae CBS 480.64]|uniref:Uncharacterized protein n=1 Tax=Piedraia hortae CBS 480.64 TaxID=1314780 RepID=A0A6A7C7U4_9PEZI|nr:hypothetical protein K470DRAFT_156158 [Piedraia hortae CBS 480.64]